LYELETHRVQRLCGEFDGINFEVRELVTGGFIPIRFAAEGVVVKAVLLDPFLPVGAGIDIQSSHGTPPLNLMTMCVYGPKSEVKSKV
jgi:hypothetical protein